MATVIEFLLNNLWIPIVALGLYVWIRLRPERPPESAAPGDDLGPPDPDSVQAGTRVTRMEVSGHVRVRTTDGSERVVDLPPSPFGAGEFPEAIWGVPGGPIFAVGKLYSDSPGADHGAVYRRDPGGDWTLVHTERDHTLHRVCGHGPDEVYAAGIGGVVCFDGRGFRFVPTTYPMMNKCWMEDDGIVLQAFDGSETHRLKDGGLTPTHARREPDDDRRTWVDADGTEYTVFDRAREVGEDTLSAEEAAEIRGELEQINAMMRG